MTIKEYLNFKIVGAKEALKNAEGAEEQAYTEGVLDAWNLMEDILPSLEQELTIRELQEFCEAHECEDCPFARLAENEYGISDFCICIVRSIKNWDVDEIEKTIKRGKEMTNRKTWEMYKQYGIQGIYHPCSECFYCKSVGHEHYCTYDKMFEVEGNNKACGAFLHRIEK